MKKSKLLGILGSIGLTAFLIAKTCQADNLMEIIYKTEIKKNKVSKETNNNYINLKDYYNKKILYKDDILLDDEESEEPITVEATYTEYKTENDKAFHILKIEGEEAINYTIINEDGKIDKKYIVYKNLFGETGLKEVKIENKTSQEVYDKLIKYFHQEVLTKIAQTK